MCFQPANAAFNYTVCDSSDSCASAKVDIRIDSSDESSEGPVPNTLLAETNELTHFNVLDYNPAVPLSGEMIVEKASKPQHGSVIVLSGGQKMIYSPDKGYEGEDCKFVSFTWCCKAGCSLCYLSSDNSNLYLSLLSFYIGSMQPLQRMLYHRYQCQGRKGPLSLQQIHPKHRQHRLLSILGNLSKFRLQSNVSQRYSSRRLWIHAPRVLLWWYLPRWQDGTVQRQHRVYCHVSRF